MCVVIVVVAVVYVSHKILKVHDICYVPCDAVQARRRITLLFSMRVVLQQFVC